MPPGSPCLPAVTARFLRPVKPPRGKTATIVVAPSGKKGKRPLTGVVAVGDTVLVSGSLAPGEVNGWLAKATRRVSKDYPRAQLRTLVDTSRAARIILPCPPPDPERLGQILDDVFAGAGGPFESWQTQR
jgi:hypothetical protein